MDSPINKDYELIKRLERDGIDFRNPQMVEFNIDFDQWPPSAEAVNGLKARFGNLKIFEPGSLDDHQEGYISLRLNCMLTLDFVGSMQKEITEIMNKYGGYCNSWAVLLHHEEM